MSETDGLPVLVQPLRWGDPEMAEGTLVLPAGTVTLLLADVEGSTRAWETDPAATAKALAELNDLVDQEIGRHDGVRPVEQGEGDSFVAAFARARDAVTAALAVQRALAGGPLRLRMGIHSGDVLRRGEGNYAGPTVNRTARLRNVAHGGQVVLSQTAADLVADALPDGASLRDLGVHRLKDLSRPEQIAQLCHPDLDDRFPPLRSLDARAHNLPVQRTSFVGRAAEMAEVQRLVDETTLVTLTGSGGCGKTRLAVQVGAELIESFADGVWLVELGAVANPAAVATQVASVFALKDAAGVAASDALAAYLVDQQALVILDNCEHVLAAAAALADTLLGACPQLRILATSQERLNLSGEVTWRVPSLQGPDDDGPAGIAGISGCEAVQLFVDRASRARPGFAITDVNAAAVADICRRLDGIPLAIELAAARTRVFTPVQIAEGLDRRFELLTGAPRTALPRQQTLRASVDWSHNLLTDLEQILLRRLSIFTGGFDYAAAQAVAGFPPIEAHQVLDLLGLLVDKSLIQVDDSGPMARYGLLETIRQYAAKRLESADELSPTGDRHRDRYLALAEEAAACLEGAEQVPWLARLTTDYPNLRAALSWSRDHQAWVPLARLVASLPNMWFVVGPNQEGQEWQEKALAHADHLPPLLRCQVLVGRCLLAMGNFDADTLAQRSGEGIDLARHLRESGMLSRLLSGRNMAAVLTGQPAPALREAETLADEANDARALAMALHVHSIACLMTDPPRARAQCEESARVAHASGDHLAAHPAEANLSCVLWWQGETREAIRLSTRVATDAERGDPYNLGTALMYQAMALAEADEPTDALAVAERLALVSRRSGMQLWDIYVPCIKAQVALAGGDTQAALEYAAEAVQLALVPLARANVLPALVEAELKRRRLSEAGIHAAELVDLSRAAGFAYYLAWGLVLQARLHRLEQNADAAEALAHEALSAATRIGAKARVTDALEVLAGLAADSGSNMVAVRLFGAARRVRDDTGYRRCVSERDADIATVRVETGDDIFGALFDQGYALSLEETVEYARRGRGQRRRPAHGWASLTPAERHVAALVKSGLSNPEIAQRLLCSPRTVQAHLTHIFAKVGVSSRAELAAEAVRQQR